MLFFVLCDKQDLRFAGCESPIFFADDNACKVSFFNRISFFVRVFRCEFELSKDGSVKWHPPPLPSSSSSSSSDHADFPLFQCDAFEVLREREGLSVVVSLRFGTYRGLVIEFDVEPAAQRSCPGVGGGTGSSTGGGGGSGGLAEDQMVLTYSGAFRLNCQRMRSQPTPLSRVVLDKSLSHPYHLLPALEDGFFSDASVVTKSGKEVTKRREIIRR